MSGSISATTLAYAGLALSAVGAGVGAIGSIEQGKASANAAKYNEAVQANNAKLAMQSANLAAAAGQAQTEQANLKTRAKVGGVIASQAAGNVDVNSGSSLDVRSSARDLGELNALTVRSNASREAFGYLTQSANASAESKLYDYQAKTAETGSAIGGAGSVLGGVGSAASKYADFKLQSDSLK